MNHTRSALALSSIALTLSICVAGMPHAAADPYDDDDSSEVISSDPGFYDAPSYDAPSYGTDDQNDWAGPDVADPGDWDQTGDDYTAPDSEPQDTGADVDPAPASDYDSPDDEAPEVSQPGPDDQQAAPAPDTDEDPATDTDAVDPTQPDAGSESTEPTDEVQTPDVDTAQVSQDDFDLTQGVPPVDAETTTASQSEITEMRESLESQFSSTSTTTSSAWSSSVTQWNSSWIGYDSYYRPVITNPYRTPMQLIYTYDNTTQIVDVAPLQRTVLTAPTPGVYSFTAVTRNGSGAPAAVSTGSFSGGGYVPAAGQQPPQKPKTPTSYDNVLVQMHYSSGTSKVFRVKKLTDLGDDPSVGGHRVLLDDETPAWGTWSKTHNGERLFQITKTQELPGLAAPSEGPLPGYSVQLANNEAAPEKSSIDPLVVTAIGAGVLALASVGFFIMTGRRRNQTN